MLEKLDATDGPYEGDVQMTFDGHNNDLINDGRYTETLDYILLRNNNVPFQRVVRKVNVFQADWQKKGKKKDLSDHYSVEITLLPKLDAVPASRVNVN